jgi:hypothetical protein
LKIHLKLLLIIVGILVFTNLSCSNFTKSTPKTAEMSRKISQDTDECPMNFTTGISALVDAESKKLSSYIGIAKDPSKKIQIEAVVLLDGRQLIVTSGGCAHIGQVFNYSTTGIATDSQAVNAMIKYLKATPTTNDGSNVKEIWMNALNEWRKKPTASVNKVINLESGDAILTLRYDLKNILQISYSFAL